MLGQCSISKAQHLKKKVKQESGTLEHKTNTWPDGGTGSDFVGLEAYKF